MFDDKCFSTITYITIYYMAHASLLLLFAARKKKEMWTVCFSPRICAAICIYSN